MSHMVPHAGPEHASLWPARKPRVARPAKGLSAVLQDWSQALASPEGRGATGQADGFVGYKLQQARTAHYAELPAGLHTQLVDSLRARGMGRLYAHQAQAFVAAQAGEHVVVATPTASGKSLAYNLPVLDALCRTEQTRALYLFPTKALSRDQEEGLRKMVDELGVRGGITTYDGDTPPDVRRMAREVGNLILTNPDMLHSGILPHHPGWARFFAGLRYVILDELHVMRGVFGSHMANVLRRLRRIAAFYGAKPQFLLASATIGNAKDHAEQLLGAPVTLVDESGAPAGRRHVAVYHPPVVHAPLGIRQGVIKATVRLVEDLLLAGVPTLVFGQSRRSVEVMLKYLRDFAARHPQLQADSIVSYRGGYLPKQRRAIERALREGEVRCVVATQALELGIDIGCLDAVVCAGYPGSVAGLWQRFGRGGRRGDDSLAILVASSQPLDQYFATQPQKLWDAATEEARIEPNNVEILLQHVKCAAFELPFAAGEAFCGVDAEETRDALDFLAEHRVLHRVVGATEADAAYHWATASYPANEVSLRLIGWDNFVIIDVARDKVIAEMDWRSTHTMLHEQAIYQHQNEQWQVERLDFDNRKAFVRLVEPDYYTEAMTHIKVTTIELQRQTGEPWPGAQGLTLQLGDVSVVEKVTGFKKVRFHTHENVGYGEVNLPEMQMHTAAMALVVPPEVLENVAARQNCQLPVVLDALRGMGHAMHLVATVGLMTSPQDLDVVLEEDQEVVGGQAQCAPILYLYDRMPGGVGLAERAFEQAELLFRQTRALLAHCPCVHGCPACVGPVQANQPYDRKGLAEALFAAWRLPHEADGEERELAGVERAQAQAQAQAPGLPEQTGAGAPLPVGVARPPVPAPAELERAVPAGEAAWH